MLKRSKGRSGMGLCVSKRKDNPIWESKKAVTKKEHPRGGSVDRSKVQIQKGSYRLDIEAKLSKRRDSQQNQRNQRS